MSLAGVHAVVTGGAQGIGAAIVRQFAKGGMDVTFMSRNKQKLETLQQELQSTYPQKFASLSVDLTDPSAVKAAFREIQSKHGEVHILVNNAGSVVSAPFRKTDLELWEKTIQVNLRSVYLCIQEVLPPMLKAKQGRIVNIASTAGIKGYPYVSAYCAAKHGVVGLTKALACEVAGNGVTVNAVCPGYTDTDLLRNSIAEVSGKTGKTIGEVETEFLRNVPQGRFIQPQEVASVVFWLCQPEQSSITGQTIAVDGGETI